MINHPTDWNLDLVLPVGFGLHIIVSDVRASKFDVPIPGEIFRATSRYRCSAGRGSSRTQQQ